MLHVISTVGPQYGGPTKAVHAMTRALADRGHRVTVATTDAADDSGGRLDIRLGEPLVEHGVTYRYFARRPAGRWKISLGLTRWLTQAMHGFDVAHVHGLFQFPTMVGCRIARWKAIPYLLRPLGTLDAWSLGQRAWKKRPYLALVEAPHIRHAAALHATSGAEAEHLRILGASRIEIIPLGVDVPTSLLTPPEAPGMLRILFLSRLHPKKGIPVLFDAVRLVRDRGIPVTLTIAGSGEQEYEAEIRRLAGRVGINEVVTWVGHVEGQAKNELFAASDLFALPSSQENFGIAVAEALAAGVPVVVSHEVAIGREVEAAGAGRSLPIDARQFADAIIEYATDPAARLAAGRAAKKFALASYSWPACAERLEALYHDVLSPGVSRGATMPQPVATVGA